MLMPVEVDRACPETLPQPLRSPWYRFPSQSYNYFPCIRPPSWNFRVKKASDEVGMCTSENPPPPKKNIGIAIKIASISGFLAKLLVLPVWVQFLLRLYLMVFSIVGRFRRKWKWIGRARKLCRSCCDHVEMSSRRLVISTSGFVDFYFLFAYAAKRSQH